MREWIKRVTIASAIMALAGCGGDPLPPQLVHEDVLKSAGLQYYWQLQIGLEEDETVSQLTRLDENLYCLTSNNRMVVIDAAVGRVKWSHVIGTAAQKVFLPAHADSMTLPRKVYGIKEMLAPDAAPPDERFDALLVNTVSYVLVFDRNTGRLYRKVPFGFAANTAGASDGELYYIASVKGWYYAIGLREAVALWWLSSEDMIRAPVKYYSGVLYTADESGMLIATNTGPTGEKRWTQPLSGAITAEFFVDERGLFVPCDDNRIYAFDPMKGRKIWDQPFACQGPPRSAIQVAEKTLFQYAQQDRFYAINLATGKQRWSNENGRLVMAVIDGEVYLLDNNNTLLVVDEILGKIRTSLPMSGWELFATNVTSPALYAATKDGKIACIRKTSAGVLTLEMLNKSATVE